MVFILSRDHALVVPQLSTHGTAVLLGKDGGEVKAPLAPLLGASTLVRSMVDESHLHPGIHGPLILSFAVAADVLLSVRDMLSVGESYVMQENIEDVKQVLNSLRVEANLNQSRINESKYVANNEDDIKLEVVFEPASEEETLGEGDDREATNNLLNIAVAINGEDIRKENVFEPASDDEETSSKEDDKKAIDNSSKEGNVDIEKLAACSPIQSYHISTLKKPYKCSMCSYSCSSSSSLKRHRRIHTAENRYQCTCTICNRSFSYPSDLQRHKCIHTGEKSFTCKICNLSVSSKGSLRTHERIHTGIKPFKCKICSYSCNKFGNLERHIRIHTGERPFSCKICSFSSSDPSNLREHLRIHTGEKPFICSICGSSFNHSSNFRKHRRVHTGEKNHGVLIHL